ncbi:MAG: CubicO group peptidase (beta-lactamase class C family) [Halobacteriales archaeon]|jgi:CubicO group peptidase (beta-lactamase class C family)
MDQHHDLGDDVRREVESFLTDWLSEHRIPGASVAIVDGKDVIYADGFGARNLASNAPATAETQYGVASITKSFTATAVLQQAEAGRVDLEDPVTEYVPFYDGLDEPPTVHELLSHSSRMPSDGASVALIGRLMGADPIEVPLSSEADVERYVTDSTTERSPDDRFFYYNTGYTVLGKLVAELDGRDFPTYVDEEILDPLGMGRSVLAPEDFDALENAMTPYRGEEGDRVEAGFPVKGVGAAGGLVSTVLDLATYLRFQFDPDGGVLDPDLLDEARTAHATRQTYLDGTEQTYGYGWMRRPFLGDELVEHGGSLGVSTAYVGYLADETLGVALACNDSPTAHPQHVGPAILGLLGNEEPASATRYYGLRKKAERVAGEYESFRGIQTATVEPDGATLEIAFETALDEQKVTASPKSTDPGDLTYLAIGDAGARIPVEFEETEDGLDLYFQRWRLHRT